jgi:hypothetical protein
MRAPPGDQQVPRPLEVFISYSRKDKEFVRQLYEALKQRDREAWVDWEDIRPTEEFMQAIFGAIEGADTFISVLTPDSVASIPCGRETAHAAARNKRIVPIVRYICFRCGSSALEVADGDLQKSWSEHM